MPQKLLFEGLRRSSNWSLQRLNNPYHYSWPQGDISSANAANALDIIEEYLGSFSLSVAADSSTNAINLTWTAVIGATSYAIWRGTSQGGETLYVKPIVGTTYQDVGTTGGVAYYYYVVAYIGTTPITTSNETSDRTSSLHVGLGAAYILNVIPFVDSSPNVNNLTNVNTVALVSTPWVFPTHAANFITASSQYLTLTDGSANNPAFDFGTNTDFSLNVWYKGNSTSDFTGIWVHCLNENTDYGWQLIIKNVAGNGVLGFQIPGGSTAINFVGTKIISDNSLHMLTVVIKRSTNTITTYVDALQDLSTSNVVISNNLSNAAAVLLGTERSKGIFLNGYLSNATIASVAWTQAQITALYGPGQPTTTTVFPWTGIS